MSDQRTIVEKRFPGRWVNDSIAGIHDQWKPYHSGKKPKDALSGIHGSLSGMFGDDEWEERSQLLPVESTARLQTAKAVPGDTCPAFV